MATVSVQQLNEQIAALNSTLSATIAANTASIASAKAEIDTFYILWAACLVFLMQCGTRACTRSPDSTRGRLLTQQCLPPACPPSATPHLHQLCAFLNIRPCLCVAGFAVLAAGSIRAKNVRNILLKNGLDACVGCVVWYLIGNGFAGGSTKGNPFIGDDPANFAISGIVDIDGTNNDGNDWINFFFSYTFAAAAATIVSGAVAERCKVHPKLNPPSVVHITCISIVPTVGT